MILLFMLIIVISCDFPVSMAFQADKESLYFLISKDIFVKYSEAERACFYPPANQSEEENIMKLMTDCNFYEIDLNDDGRKEIVVKENWFSEWMDAIGSGNKVRMNYMRGAQDNGCWYIYEVKNNFPLCIGQLETGAGYEILKSKTNGYKDIETYHHMSAFENIVDVYQYSDSRYKLVSSKLYGFEEGKPKKKF